MIEAVLLSLSLCADCFAVSLCSSVTLKKLDFKSVTGISLLFAVVQAGLLMLGWFIGDLFYGLVETVSGIIGFLMLLYVGGSMLLEGIKGSGEGMDLSGFRNILIGGFATSIDAMAVGVSQSMGGARLDYMLMLFVVLFALTALSVAVGIICGSAICNNKGRNVGRIAEIVGGLVLIGIGVRILL